jgi:hypothetical protein
MVKMQFTFKKIIFSFFILLGFTLIVNKTIAQEPKKNVEVIQDYRIKKLVDHHIAINEKKRTISGYRVQIHFGNLREPAKEVKSKFLSLYDNVPAYEIYQQPNFKIRVGDFRTKLEATKLLKEISSDFPNAFIVPDDISLPPID